MGVVVRQYIDLLILFIPIYCSFLQQHPYFWLFLHVTCTSNDIIVQLWLCFNDSSGCALV